MSPWARMVRSRMRTHPWMYSSWDTGSRPCQSRSSHWDGTKMAKNWARAPPSRSRRTSTMASGMW